MRRLDGLVALVTGASRGVGRGVAASLSGAGAVVYGTGRSIGNAALPADIIRLPCDHGDDDAVARVFESIQRSTVRLDVLVNNAWGGYERMFEGGSFTWPEVPPPSRLWVMWAVGRRCRSTRR